MELLFNQKEWIDYTRYISRCILNPKYWSSCAWFVDYYPEYNILSAEANGDHSHSSGEQVVFFVNNPYEFLVYNSDKNTYELRHTPTAYDDFDEMYDRVVYLEHIYENNTIKKYLLPEYYTIIETIY